MNPRIWKKAQKSEKSWWEKRINSLNLDFYRQFAEEIVNDIKEHLPLSTKTRILEIGSGAAGNLTFIKTDYRFAIDPLELFFASIPRFQGIRDKNVSYLAAMGEALPFKDSSFDLVIIANVLDHCLSPETVIQETTRVTKNGGIIHLKQNIFSPYGKFIRMFIYRLGLDRKHPFAFTENDVEKVVMRNQLTILTKQRRGFLRSLYYAFSSPESTSKGSAILLAMRDQIKMILKK